MNEKDQFDALMKLAEFWLSQRNVRNQVLIRFSAGLWALMVAGIAYLKRRPPESELIAVLILLFVCNFAAVRLAHYRNLRDSQLAQDCAHQAEGLLVFEKAKPSATEHTILWADRWIMHILSNPYLGALTWVGPTFFLSVVAYLVIGQPLSSPVDDIR